MLESALVEWDYQPLIVNLQFLRVNLYKSENIYNLQEYIFTSEKKKTNFNVFWKSV